MWNIISHFKAKEKCPQNGCPENSGSFPHQGLSTPLNIIFPSLLGKKMPQAGSGCSASQSGHLLLPAFTYSSLRWARAPQHESPQGINLFSEKTRLRSEAPQQSSHSRQFYEPQRSTEKEWLWKVVEWGLGRRHIQWRACPPSMKIWVQYPTPT